MNIVGQEYEGDLAEHSEVDIKVLNISVKRMSEYV